MHTEHAGRRIIEVGRRIIDQTAPRPHNKLCVRKLSDYPHVPAAYLDVARRLSSPLMLGPPICDELIEFVRHLLTEEEAGAVRHLGLLSAGSAADVATAEHRPLHQIAPLLDRLSTEKPVLARSGPPGDRRYRLLPIVPGIFEMTLITHTPESLTPWHHRFIELFEALYETGFSLDYGSYTGPAVRYLPVGKAVDGHPMALPSDKLEAILDRFDAFAVGQCQCRLAMQSLGKGCGKPLGNCLVMGDWAVWSIQEGRMKAVSKQEALDIKRQAEAHGMVNWMMNVEAAAGQSSCSCCGCCCHALRIVNEFNAPGLIAPPHFLPRLDPAKCTSCGRCAASCPMGAILVETGETQSVGAVGLNQVESDSFASNRPPAPRYQHLTQRCIGCGLCVLACDRQHALTMEPASVYRGPYRNWFSLIAHAVPGFLWNSLRLWQRRR